MSSTDRLFTNRSPRDARRRDPITVMVVDDEKDPRESVCEWLAAKGYAVVPARDGADALRQLRESDGHKPDVILLDLMMPVMNGWQFRREQQQDPNLSAIPVLVLSAGNHVAEAAASIGAVGYLRKPVSLDDLFSAVERVCEGARGAAGP